jgi:outer membrane protein OmpA-like peptidoglycan-associated protein
MRARRIFAFTIATTAVLATASAGAQEQAGFASNHFQPSERGSRWFALDDLDMAGNGRLAIGLVNDYSYRSLVGYHPDGTISGSVVRNQYYAHLGASVLLADRFRIALNVPLQVYADGQSATIAGALHRAAEDVDVGDVRASADARLFGEKGDAATMAAGAHVMLPAGTTSAYTGDGKPRVVPHLLFAGKVSSFAYSANAGFQVRGRDEAWGNGYLGSGVVFGASAGLLLANERLLVGPEVVGSTVTADGRAFDERTTPVELLLGAHYDVGDFRVGAGAGTALARGYGAPVARGLLSFEWVPGDAKPEVEATKVVDRDGDGVADCEDACGWAAGPRSNDPDKNGCPPADADKDGVPDEVDACPLAAGVSSSDPKANGCPADADSDGVPDLQDACPREAGKRTLDAKTNGCPERDQDGDGVLDADDACLTTAGVHTSDPKTNGCPKAFLEDGRITISEQVRFETASAEIAPDKDSQEILEAVVAVLKAHPEAAHVLVEGHTDDRGDAKANKTLSQARAESVVDWLVAHGVAKSRLGAAGFGSERPLEPNTTEAGRAKNRRVELHLDQKSSGSEGSAR